AGLRYIYAGNLPGQVGELENTYCPNCDELLIERYGYLITGYYLTSNGSCPSCGTTIPGRWDPSFQGQITDHPVRRACDSLRSPFWCVRAFRGVGTLAQLLGIVTGTPESERDNSILINLKPLGPTAS